MAYPIYLTIGNIPKDIRRKPSSHAHILIGYIPVTKLTGIDTQAGRRRALNNLFHGCMRNVLDSISYYGETGVPMMSGDGVWRRCHPIFANFIGDYPEQVLVTCTYSGQCPKCQVPPDQLGEYATYPSRVQATAIDTYILANDSVRTFHRVCREAGLKPVPHPFWEKFPLADIFLSITPDILHQLLQGMVKHLVRWVIRVYRPGEIGSAHSGARWIANQFSCVGEIDARCRAMPPNHKILLFAKGISTLSRISGHEHKKMCSILLGLVVDLPVPDIQDSSRIIKSVRALLDFVFLAQYKCHTTETIEHLQDCLAAFHDHKAVFVDLGVRENFNLPKLHSLTHYMSSIQLFGTTDNYNTEQSERLHIDLAKDAYRATNRKDEYAQMTAWLERREKMQRHAALINRRRHGLQQHAQTRKISGPPCTHAQHVKMARHPSVKAVSFDVLKSQYGALNFQDALANFIAQVNNPGARGSTLRLRAEDTLIPFRGVPVFHVIKFTEAEKSETIDSVLARPEQKDKHGRIIPSRFDTVLIRSASQDTAQGRIQGNSHLLEC